MAINDRAFSIALLCQAVREGATEFLGYDTESAEGVAKLWLRPAVAVAFSAGYDRRALAGIVTTVSARRDEIERAWHEFFG